MSFETRITRQSIPSKTAIVGPDELAVAVARGDSSQLKMLPPDESGSWRYREMNILPPTFTEPGHTVTPDTSYYVPPKCSMSPTEILVVWEKYIEEI